MTTEQFTLEMGFADGAGTQVVGQDHPLVSVFRRAVQSGKYTGQWMFLAVKSAPDAHPKLLGTIVWTPGGRFLFFHGRVGDVQSTHPDKSLNGKRLDHITLELAEDMQRFEEHVAVLPGGKRSRGQVRCGPVHAGHLHPWFSLLLRDLDAYEPLPATFRFEFSIPLSDVSRRSRALMGSGKRTASAFPQPPTGSAHYFQLDVWAGRGPKWSQKFADALPWPTLPGVVAGHCGEPVTRSGQLHDFTDDAGVITVLTRPSGSLELAGLMHTVIQPAQRDR